MKRATILTVVIILAALTATTGCYTTQAVEPAKVAAIRRPLTSPRALGPARLGPRSDVRARLTDGSLTPWVPATDLAVSNDGLVTGRRYPLALATEAAVADAGPAAFSMLAAVAPPESEIVPERGWIRLRVRQPSLLLPWISAYTGGAAALHHPPGPCVLRTSPRGWSDPVPCASIAGVPAASLPRLQIADGVPWRKIAALEVHNLDPIQTSFAVLGTPVLMSVMMLGLVSAAAAISDGDDPTPGLDLAVGMAQIASDAAAHADDGAETGGAPVHLPNQRAAVLIAAAAATDGSRVDKEAGPTGDPAAGLVATPLFTQSARRRDYFKWLLAADAGITSEGTFTGGVTAGFRLNDFVEIAGRARLLWLDEQPAWAPDGSQIYRGTPHALFGARLGFHIDGDGDRISTVFGGEVLGGSLADGGTLWQLGLNLGPRFGIGEKTFASLLFAPSLLVKDRPDGATAVGQVMFTAELGFDF